MNFQEKKKSLFCVGYVMCHLHMLLSICLRQWIAIEAVLPVILLAEPKTVCHLLRLIIGARAELLPTGQFL